ncbi:MAG: VapC toxin family PIN domain ribonuclease [SAR202 cluster bacterium Io17-Chloro-G4]|nr:MAG: VapC toxin family PIN domain ribonuclease [SAR202 cluster bacterium Io17-Chloro-G4]
MDLLDVNVLVYAHKQGSPNHRDYRLWLEELVQGDEAYGISDIVLSGFLRIVTHPSIFRPPSDIGSALEFATRVRERPNCVQIYPGPRHWSIFTRLCQHVSAKGNLVPDAYFAALAIESGSVWVTSDRDYGKFPGLKWRHPLGS